MSRYSSIPISCIRFLQRSCECLMVGEVTGRVQVLDGVKNCRVRQMNIHYDRVGIIKSMEGAFNANAFLTGSKDKLIKINDLRLKKSDVQTMEKHQGQVCGASLQNNYLATGGNDNRVVIWDLRKSTISISMKKHNSAVKALAWCPWRSSVLASGGGSNDRKIIIWNGNSNIVESQLNVESQVSHIFWKETEKTMISSHYNGKDGFCHIWQGGEKKYKLKGHHGRIIGLEIDPSNSNQMCSIGSDETLRFWKTSIS